MREIRLSGSAGGMAALTGGHPYLDRSQRDTPAAVTTPGAISTRHPGVLTAAGSCCAPPTPIWDSSLNAIIGAGERHHRGR